MRRTDPQRGPRILESAARLFEQRPYHEVRMDDVAAHAGVAKGTLYRYFRDKEALYLGLILAGLDGLYDEMRRALPEAKSPEAKVYRFVDCSLRFFERNPSFIDLVQRVEVGGDAAGLDALNASRGRFFQLTHDLIAELVATGRHAPDVRLAALALTGMTRQTLRFYPQPWPKNLAELLTNQFLHGLSAPPGSKPLQREK